MWDLIVSVPDHCLSFYFVKLLFCILHFCIVRADRRKWPPYFFAVEMKKRTMC